ncbi:MAG: DsbA family protein [Candidatus Moraniibacteriota bacterium]
MDEMQPISEGEAVQAEKSCCRNQGACRCGYENESGEKGAWIVAGAVLLSGLMVAASILTSVKPGKSTGADGAPSAQPTAAQPAAAVTLDQVKALFTSKNLAFGNKESKVLFVEFSDPSCPFCHVAAGKNPSLNKQVGGQFVMVKEGGTYIAPVPEMKKLVDAGKAGFVWLYANGHGNGEMATKALYCAHEKGKFWEVHDLLMNETGYSLLNDDVKNDIAKAGTLANFLKSAVSVGEMQACLESGKYDNRIVDDMAVAQQFGFRGTPSFFINQTNFAGAVSFKEMQSTVDKLLK